MKIVASLPRDLRAPRFVAIPMADGVVLSARLWLPVLAPGERVPAIVDCHPYRASDSAAVRDSRVYPYFAGHGYACLRVDLRGSGNSGGVLADEYLSQEQDDALEVLRWLAAQEWCTGDAGWIGISWGGFAGLQVAARRPPQLKALITICSTDDRYADDVHYRGGCLLASDMLSWASTMLTLNALPPDPTVVGEAWRDLWRLRLEETPPYIEPWLRHQQRDTYWRHGSVCEDFDAINVPTLVVGGWADGYVDSVSRLMDGLRCPHKGIIGPWAHGSPLDAGPGPSIGFLQECLRWWDRWLKDADTGVERDPALRAWMQEAVPPATFYRERPGRWLGLEWPPSTRESVLFLDRGSLADGPGDGRELRHRSPCTPVSDPGEWCPAGSPGDWPGDQGADDGISLSFTSLPLAEPLETLGNVIVNLELAIDRTRGEVVVRLCDVAPSGESLLVTRAIFNLAHRGGHEQVVDMEPGTFVQVLIALKAAGHRFPAGHRVRVSLGTAYWPWAWPSPDPVELVLRCGERSYVSLPVFEGDTGAPVHFAEPEQANQVPYEVLGSGSLSRTFERDSVTGTVTIRQASEAPAVRLPGAGGLEFSSTSTNTFAVREGEPLSARVVCARTATRRRGDWDIRIETASEMSSTPETFLVSAHVRAFESGALSFERRWHFEIPRA